MTDPVIVVGAGPTGLLLAAELALAGVPTVVLDRDEAPAPHSPGQAVNSAVMEILDQRGLADELREAALPLPGAHFSLLWLRPEELPGPPAARGLLVPQSRLEDVLRRRAEELGVEIRRGTQVVDLGRFADSVSVRVRTADGEQLLRGSYVVGADGADSTVRKLAGIGFPGSGWTVSGTVGDIEADFADLSVQHLGAHYMGSGGIYSGAPAGPATLRVITTTFAEDGSPGTPVSLDRFQADIEELTGRKLPARRLLWAERFTSVSGNAERYRLGRVLLAGDAAHSFYPLGGLRLSTCLQDAVNLGWKLAADLAGWAPPGLLDTYHAERHPEGERARLALDAQLALMHPAAGAAGIRALFNELTRLDQVNEYLVKLVTGTDVRYLVEDAGEIPGAADLLGHRLPGTAPLLRAGRGVLIAPSTRAHAAAGWADRVDTVDPTAAGTAPALLRPDGYVVWAEGAGDLERALKQWFGAPR
jgi:2-polyprenyl-6-methoxyphenol hydroxylase-like FAD-dependent oxidoreductase